MSTFQAAAYSPCHITGFFQVHYSTDDLQKVGSTGAGVALQDGVVTRIRIARAPRTKISVSFNGKPLANPIVSREVVRYYLNFAGGPLDVQLEHRSNLPIGAGYGTSGAGALGASLSLNEALGSPLSKLQAAGVAHEAEVRCRTGLGTVTAVFHGGFLARLKPGSPAVGQVRKLPVSKSDSIISATYGPISTSQFLSRRGFVKRVNSCGRGLVTKLLKLPSLRLFLGISRDFSQCLGVMPPRLSRLLKLMNESGVRSSMMMIGNSVFTGVPKDEVADVSRFMRKHGLAPLVSRISSTGARLL